MAKPDINRDYYADLGISSSADAADIKKQFRKLALQYHPDRNPGREAEVNAKFQIIQSAHEVLSDPDAKAKYDANRRSRYPTASGVRGNPWQDVAKDFPAPPRRAGADRSSRAPPPRPPSGAHKYANFTSGAAPTAKQPPREDPEARRNAWQAFENMRPSSQGKSAASAASQARKPVPPPRPTESASTRPVPRTPGQKQKAEAAFGARKPGYAPHSPVPGDEPSASSSGYATNRHTYDASSANAREPIPDPLAQFREKVGSDSRQSTPYHSGNGEKVDPFDGVPLGRAKSTRERESPRTEQRKSGDNLSPGGNRYRSSSASGPRTATSSEANDGSEIPQRYPFTSRASARYTPAGVTPNTSGPGTPTGLNGSGQAHPPGGSAGQAEGPSMYAKPPFSRQPSSSFKSSSDPANGGKAATYAYPYGNATAPNASGDLPSSVSPSPSPLSGGLSSLTRSLSSYERDQQEMLKSLIVNAYSPSVLKKKREISRSSPATSGQDANKDDTRSFNFAVDDDTFSPTSGGPSRFARSSADDINTRFANNQSPDDWRFTAGSPVQEGQDPHKKRRAQPGNGIGRDSPQAAPPRPPKEHVDGSQPPPMPPKTKWDAQGWEGIGAENFAPQPAAPASASPTRPPTRTYSRKPKVKATAGSAGLVNEESSSDENRDFTAPRPHVEVPISDSPMDIDSPPPTKPSAAPPQPPTARNIHVEPSNPEWRQGNGKAIPDAHLSKPVLTPAFNPNAGGSEDSEEFAASFADLRNVAPFAQKPSGLNSFGDLKSNLPFESRASGRVALDQEKKKPEVLDFPSVPRAPNPPPALAVPNLKPSTAAWHKYLQEFQEYMMRWDEFNAQVASHFDARKHQIQDSRKTKGYAFLTTQGTEGIQEYLEYVQQDREIRRQWAAACDDHEQRVKSFLTHRVQMM
ncbi:DnaJ domain-containing protein [Plectosphaerella plurivora]|uniref:DnaJ domain-containing protein n=1 Tax=Plectosphaerella plurivora TaxID=936078 RepID=A0A9P8VBB3_9PEZI|nr:DnaJ domain-containing protein [Plectosphaerella plurivora]